MATTTPTRARWRRGGGVSAAGAGAVAVATVIGRLVMLAAALVALVIVVGIAFVVFKANPSNSIVSWVHDTAHTLVGPFDGLFKPKDPKLAIGINWGLAAIVYLIVGRFIARLLMR